MSRSVLDLLVIGAGPAGCAAAIEAAYRGLTAVVIDRAHFPRDKCCGDGLTTACLRQLEALGLDPAAVSSWQAVSGVRVTTPAGRVATFPLPRNTGTYAAIARRTDLDAALVARARQAGADIREGLELEAIEIEPGGSVSAVAGGRRLRARHVVAADGVWSPTRRLLGSKLPGYRGEWQAFRQYFHSVSAADTGEVQVWFDRDLLPGYAWLFPLADGSANVGFGILRRAGHRPRDAKELWQRILARPDLRAALGPQGAPAGRQRAWPIPARLGDIQLSIGPVLFAGDAAAATDPLTGEGIGQALETGRQAVACIVAGGGPAAVAGGYERALRTGMIKDHRLAGALSKRLGTGAVVEWSVALAGSSAWARRNFARWLFEDYPRAVLGTPRRWRRRLFSGEGAFRPAA